VTVGSAVRVLAASFAASFAVGLGLGLAPPGSAAAGASSQPVPTIELVSQPTWVREGDRFTVGVDISGAPAGATLDMIVYDPPTSREEFRETLTGELGDELQVIDPVPVTAAAGSTSMGFTIGAGGVTLPTRGAYPVEVRLLGAGGEPVASLVTYLSYLTSRPGPPLDVAVVVDLAAPSMLQPDGTYAELPAAALDRMRERVQVMADTADVPLTVAPRPETLEALANGPADGVTLLRQLAARVSPATATRVLARPFVDIDFASLQRAQLLDSEAPAQRDNGADVVRARLGVEPIPGVWLAGPAFGADSSRIAVDLGVGRAIVPPTAVDDGGDGGDGGDSDDRLADVPQEPVRYGEDGPTVMVSDPALAEHLTDTGENSVVAAHRFVAELESLWLESPAIERSVVVHVPAGAPIDPEAVAVALGAFRDGQALRATSVEEIFDAPPLDADAGRPTVTPAAPTGVPDLGGVADAVEAAREQVSGVGSLLGDPELTRSLDHSLLVSTGVDTPDAERAAHVERVAAALRSVEGAVTLPDEFRITLTSRSSTIPVTLTNNTEQPLTVRVELDSAQLEFPDGDVFTPTLEHGTSRIDVPVRARTSGAFTLDVRVTSVDQTIVLDESTFDIRSTAISGVGLVLSAGAVLFLAVWWGRHWRDARRSRRLLPPDAMVAAPGGRPEGAAAAGLPHPPPPGRGPPVGGAAAPRGEDDRRYRPAHMARPRDHSG
jgi:hypothetical protein